MTNFSKSLLPKFIVTLVVLTYRIEQSYPTVLTWWDRTSSLFLHEAFEPEISVLIRLSKVDDQLDKLNDTDSMHVSHARPIIFVSPYYCIDWEAWFELQIDKHMVCCNNPSGWK